MTETVLATRDDELQRALAAIVEDLDTLAEHVHAQVEQTNDRLMRLLFELAGARDPAAQAAVVTRLFGHEEKLS
jgi:hypothetical protein